MAKTNFSRCGRFVVVDALHLDRTVFDRLAAWASSRQLSIQDAIQVALCFFDDADARDAEDVASSETFTSWPTSAPRRSNVTRQ